MKTWQQLILTPNASIREAIAHIDSGNAQIALVVDERRRLLGTVTDGDVRRGILKGCALDEAVSVIMNPAPTVAHVNDVRGTILRLMRQGHLHQIPILDDDGRVSGLEVLDELLQPGPKPNSVVIMAGGVGSRLRPMTDDCPKPMLHVGNKPILETILESFIEYGFNDFHIAVNYKAEMVKNHFGDGSRWKVAIQYLEEDRQLGTAGALGLLGSIPSAPIVVMNGDILTKVNFQHLLDFHSRYSAVATMCVRSYEYQIPFGVVAVDGDRLLAIEEKPKQQCFVSAGIYVLAPEALALIQRGCHLDMPALFGRLVEAGHPTAVFPVREYWLDIGRLEDFEQATGDFLREFR